MKATQEAVARALLTTESVRFEPKSPVTFKSGIKSPIYVDNRRLPFHPQRWSVILDGFEQFINSHRLNIDVIAGVEAAGIPHSAALGYKLQKPSVFVRKQPKGHGTKKRVEGGDVTDKKILLVEDLVTTGSSSLDAISALSDEGGIAKDCICIITYGFQSAFDNFTEKSVQLHPLTTFDVVLEIAMQLGQFSKDEYGIIQDWFTNPTEWAKKHGFKDK